MKDWEYKMLHDPDPWQPTHREARAVTAVLVLALVLVIVSVYVMFI